MQEVISNLLLLQRAKTDLISQFFFSGSTNNRFTAYFNIVYTQPNKIWREKVTKQIIILVLVLPEFGSGKLKNILKREIAEDQKVIKSSFFVVHTYST